MHIFLFILSRIGLVLLGIIGLILLLLLVVLFAPIVYRGTGSAVGLAIEGEVRISWLLRIVYVKIEYKNKKPFYEVYLFGIPLMKTMDYLEKRKEKKAAKKKEKVLAERKKADAQKSGSSSEERNDKKPSALPDKKSGVMVPERSEKASTDAAADSPDSEEIKVEEDIPEIGGLEKLYLLMASILAKVLILINKAILWVLRICGKILYYVTVIPQKIFGAIAGVFRKIGNLWKKIAEGYELIASDMFKEAFRCVKGEVIKILKHIRPRRIRGKVAYGFEDPATTGQVLGMAAAIYPWTRGKLEVIPDFENPKLEADIELRGHIQVFVLVWHGVIILLNKQVRALIKKFR